MKSKIKLSSLLALILFLFPVGLLLLKYQPDASTNQPYFDYLFYPLIFGGIMSFIILLLNKYILGKTFKKTFNPAREPVSSDVVMGIILTIILFILYGIEKVTLFKWFPQPVGHQENLAAFFKMIAYNPLIIAVWLGPVLWIGIAIFEELTRIFMQRCLWNFSDNKHWQRLAIVFVALLTSMIHWQQGIAGILSVTIQGLLLGFYFYKFRRILPLILAHGFYEGIQILAMIMQYR